MNETTVITGANRGLGYETTLALAGDSERTIVMAGRDLQSLRAAAQRIRSATGNDRLVPMALDLASLASVRAFAHSFRERELPPLTTIICNAGISRPGTDERSAEGYELTFAVNHLGHFLLVQLLLADLQPPARILFVSSGAHNPEEIGGPMRAARYGKAKWLAYPERDPGEPGDAYATSKLCNVLCTYELQRRLEESGLSSPASPITVNAFDPGLVAGTGLGRNAEGMTRIMWYYVLPWLSRLMRFGRSARQSGEDLAYLATAPELEGVSGKYFSGRERKDSSADSHDMGKAADLWQTSVALCDLQPHESPLIHKEEA